jgi:hypothetical protein
MDNEVKTWIKDIEQARSLLTADTSKLLYIQGILRQ